MKPNAEVLVWEFLRSVHDQVAQVHLDVPATRPRVLITIERTGGAGGRLVDSPSLAVQCWHADGRYEASELARKTAHDLAGLIYHPLVGSAQIHGPYNFPSPDGVARYQMVLDLVTV